MAVIFQPITAVTNRLNIETIETSFVIGLLLLSSLSDDFDSPIRQPHTALHPRDLT